MPIATPASSILVKDPNLNRLPIQLLAGGTPIVCQAAINGENVVLPAATTGLALPFPPGVVTAKLVAIQAVDVSDLIVTYGAQALVLPKGQVMFLYDVVLGDVLLGSVLGGKIVFVVGA